MKTTNNRGKPQQWEWLDLESPSDSDIAQLAEEQNIHQVYIQDLMQAEHLPKAEEMEEPEGTFIIARYYDPSQSEVNSINEMTRKLVLVHQHGKTLITVHRGHWPPIDTVKQKYVDGKKRSDDFFVLCKLVKEVFRSYEPLAIKLSEDLDYYEGRLFLKQRDLPIAKSFYQLKRKIAIAKKVLSLSKSIVEFLQDQDREAAIVQDVEDMYVRIETSFDEVNDRFNNLINLNLNFAAQRNNDVIRVLTLFSVFFLPVTFIVGVYGMNFQHMPELGHPYGYWAVWVAMLLVSGSIYWWFRKKGWLG
jgi:magnesium transporter